MEKVLGEQQSQTQTQLRQDLSEQYGIKAKQDEINSLTQSYNAVVQAKDNQIMATQDKMGSMNFINNQVQQIERNAAPRINQLSSDINFKTGILTQSMELVQQAIQDYNADKKQRMDMYSMFLDENQDEIKNLREDYKDALARGWQEAKFNYENGVKQKQDIADLALKYYKAGITLNDTWETAVMKAQRNPQTKETKGTKGTNTEDIDAWVKAIRNGDATISNIPANLRTAVINAMNKPETKLQILGRMGWAAASKLNNMGIDKTKREEIRSLLGQGYTFDEIIASNPNAMTLEQQNLLRRYIK